MKSNTQNPFQPFPSAVFRSPYFSITQYIEWLTKLDASPDYLKEILLCPDIQEAIFLASPVLHDEVSKYLEDRLKPKDREKFFYSFLKYLARMATRCTPFGLFAGCSVGQITDRTQIFLPVPDDYLRHTRLDMNYLCALAQNIAKREDVKYKLRYFPNNSSYVVGDRLRYVEYRYHNGNRRHSIVAIDHSPYIQRLLATVKEGATVEQLANSIVDHEISQEAAIEFIDELIDNQVIVSELEPSITGPELLDQIIATLEKMEGLSELQASLKSLLVALKDIDAHSIGSSIPLYGQVKNLIKALGTTFSEHHLFQSDMFKPCEKAEISQKITDEILEAITFLINISPAGKQETFLNKFANSFIERYGGMEMPLAQLLDTEMGLEFLQSGNSGDLAPLIDGIPFSIRQQEHSSHSWSGLQSLLHRKVIEALAEKHQEIVLTEEDVMRVTPKWDDLPHTIGAMCKLFSYTQDEEIKLYLNSVGGSSTVNLLGRFCHVDEHIYNTVRNFVQEEDQSLPDDKLHAEVVHLPESRIGNILARPVLRPYEIPYLAKSGVDAPFQLGIDDLLVSVKKGKFVLRSKRLEKEIIPKLSTAHNYSHLGLMPIYQFLCNLQHQNTSGRIGLSLSGLFNEFPFLPRISYKNIILSLARWYIKPEEIKQIVENKESLTAVEMLNQWKAHTGIPRFVVLPDGDNELFTDTESLISLRMLYNVIKKRPQCTLREYPFDLENAILNSKAGAFTNEFLFTFHKKRQV
ncbi:MAG: lantibiotic dehydratase family protein [Prevotellaceae bacterium]|jgi:hypothetical protein|nr:lantibiotic dehydratase family protein [Prevotellaceae bacterium]